MTVEKQSYEQPKAQRIPQPTIITNVVATLKGTQPESTDRIYVVSGHYDSMCNSPTDAKCDAPGANDDASGTAAVLEMARVMAKYEFDATIVFMAVAGEEQSLLGSTHFAEQAKQKNWNIDAMFTNDIIGNTLGGNGVRDRGTVRVFSEGVPSNETTAGSDDTVAVLVARTIRFATTGAVHQRDRRRQCAADESDVDLPARSIWTWRRSHSVSRARLSGGAIHGSERRVPASASKRSGREWCAVWRPAGVCRFRVRGERGARECGFAGGTGAGAFAAKGVTIVTARLSNDTDLRWEANKEPDLAGYEIVWRDTTSAVWTNSKPVGNVTSFTMKGMSKDNYFFGVRAIDRMGTEVR